jgi:hypothetical protein
MMLLVGARASPGHRQSAVCRLAPPGPACRMPGGGPPAFRSPRLLFSWLEDAGLWSGRRGPTDAGAPLHPRALGFAARPGPAHEAQHVAPGEAVWKPAVGAADVRRPRRRRWCLCSKPCQCPTHDTSNVTNIQTISGTGRKSPARSHRCSRAVDTAGCDGTSVGMHSPARAPADSAARRVSALLEDQSARVSRRRSPLLVARAPAGGSCQGCCSHRARLGARRLDRVIAPARSRGSTTRPPCCGNACSASGATCGSTI